MPKTYGYLVRRYEDEIGDVYRLTFDMGDHSWESFLEWPELKGKVLVTDTKEANVFVTYITEGRKMMTLALDLRDDELRSWLHYLNGSRTKQYKGVGRPQQAHMKLTSYKERLRMS